MFTNQLPNSQEGTLKDPNSFKFVLAKSLSKNMNPWARIGCAGCFIVERIMCLKAWIRISQ